jgi:hypothetical protein
MEPASLQKIVSEALQGNAFKLDATSSFGTGALQGLWSTLLAQPTLELSGATVDTTTQRPSAEGVLVSPTQSSHSFLAGLHATATFRLDTGGQPQVAMVLAPLGALSVGWTPATLLPVLGAGSLDDFAWTATAFEFDSEAPSVLPATFPAVYGMPANSATFLATLHKGMSLAAEISYTGSDAGLKWLFTKQPVRIAGPVEWGAHAARMDLGSATLVTQEFGGFSLPIDFHLVAGMPEALLQAGGPETPAVDTLGFAVLHGEIDRPVGAQKLKIPFYAALYGSELQIVSVVGDFSQASALALGEVAQLLGVGSLATQQPSALPLTGLALEQLQLTLDISSYTVISASATVGYKPTGGPWKPFGDVAEFDGMSVTFTAIGPLSSPTLETKIDATMTLAGGELDAEVSLPGLDFSCELAQGSEPIDLTKLMSEIAGTSFGEAKLQCTELRVLGNGSTGGHYRLQARIADDWSFTAGGANFALSSVGFDITHTPGAGSSTTGEVVAELQLAGVAVQIGGEYDSSTPGLKLWGGTLGVQRIPLTELLSDVLAKFGLSLPAHAPTIYITDLQMMLQTHTLEFGFSCEAEVSMMDTTVQIGLDVGRAQLEDGPATVFQGTLAIGKSHFEVDFNDTPTSKGLKFSWTDTEEPLEFEDIAAFFGFAEDVPKIPEGLDLQLTGAELYYDFDSGALALGAQSRKYGDVYFVSYKEKGGGPRVNVLEIMVPLGMSLSHLPVVGELVPAQPEVGVKDVGVVLAWGAKPTLAPVNALLQDIGASPLSVLSEGVTLMADFSHGSETVPLVLPLSSQSSGTTLMLGQDTTPGRGEETVDGNQLVTPTTPNSTPSAGYGAGAKWFTVNKTLGPVQLQRVGVQYQEGDLFFLLDATLALATLTIGLQGLGIGSSLSHVSLAGKLDGLSLGFSAGPVTISGGLLEVPTEELPKGVEYEYAGEATIAIEEFLVSGAGSYAKVEGRTSLFLFVEATGEFGGPPAFFVTGFMGGFGYNSQLTLPEPDGVYAFPFLAGFEDKTIFGPNPTPTSVLAALLGSGGKPAVVTPKVDADWLAAGILFRSFELILGRVLLAVTFGRDVEIALLGLASMSLPQGGGETYAYVELQLEVIVEPSVGYFAAEASLTPASYLLTSSCHLTGGFAFCLWFGPNPHAGDFVLTVGGYHPAFEAPEWYPQVSPVGFNWVVDSNVVVKGGAYFAITPSAAMAGGNLEALYQSGDLKAWFTAWANMLVRWKPFYFEVGIGISVGASYRLNLLFTTVTLSVELGASLELWGPPTGGVAHVHWYIISFSVSFGAESTGGTSAQLKWGEFTGLLPQHPALQGQALAAAPTTTPAAASAVLSVQINGGLSSQDSATGAWTVRADELVFTTSSAVPCSSISLNDDGSKAPSKPSSGGIEIRPMELSGVASVHCLLLRNLDEERTEDLNAFAPVTQTSALPESLWGAPLNGANPPSAANTVKGLQTGVRLTAPHVKLGASPGPMDVSKITEPLPSGPRALEPKSDADQLPAPTLEPHAIAKIVEAFDTANLKATEAAQGQLLATLGKFSATPPTHDPTVALGETAGSSFTQPPLVSA